MCLGGCRCVCLFYQPSNVFILSQDSEVEVSGVMSGAVSGDDVWGEPVERCMHCFRDFPLSKLVAHSQKCEGDMLGPRERFRGFLPSVHDVCMVGVGGTIRMIGYIQIALFIESSDRQ